jgi:hypothetical protein
MLTRFWVVGFLLLGLPLAGCGGGSKTPTAARMATPTATATRTSTATPASTSAPMATRTSTAAPTATPAASPIPTPTPTPTPQPQTFTGTGDKATAKFQLNQGLAVFDLEHSGKSNYAVELLAEDGSLVDVLVNTIGSYKGTVAIGVQTKSLIGAEPGSHMLNVKADGNWTITLRYPDLSKGAGLPQTFTGQGDAVSPPFLLTPGLANFSLSHSGRANFAVILYYAAGEMVDVLVNEIGAYQGSTAVGVQKGSLLGAQPGVHVLAIHADGDWSARIE